mmetsp:Transcript_69802/g.102285  ORF Transcript_69802/g.102285 Transcript_69802/m.102285 type:complete len:418 (+) Transcript_69802:82-1335(+)
MIGRHQAMSAPVDWNRASRACAWAARSFTLIMCLAMSSEADVPVRTTAFVGGLEFEGLSTQSLKNITLRSYISSWVADATLKVIITSDHGLDAVVGNANESASSFDVGPCLDSTHPTCSRAYFVSSLVSKAEATSMTLNFIAKVARPAFAADLSVFSGVSLAAIVAAATVPAQVLGGDGVKVGIANHIHAQDVVTHMSPGSITGGVGLSFEKVHGTSALLEMCIGRFSEAKPRCNSVDTNFTSVTYIQGDTTRERCYVWSAPTAGHMCGLWGPHLTSIESEAVRLLLNDAVIGCETALLTIHLEHGEESTFSAKFQSPLLTAIAELSQTDTLEMAVLSTLPLLPVSSASQDPLQWRDKGLDVAVQLPSVSGAHRDWQAEEVGSDAVGEVMSTTWYGQRVEQNCVTLQGKQRCESSIA